MMYVCMYVCMYMYVHTTVVLVSSLYISWFHTHELFRVL